MTTHPIDVPRCLLAICYGKQTLQRALQEKDLYTLCHGSHSSLHIWVTCTYRQHSLPKQAGVFPQSEPHSFMKLEHFLKKKNLSPIHLLSDN